MLTRTFFWSRYFVLAVAGALIASPSFAETSLRWKTPKVQQTATASQANPIQQVRYDRQQVTPIPIPKVSPEAKIDTQFPESRQQYGPTTTTPAVPLPNGSRSLIEGDDIPSDVFDENGVKLSEPLKGTKVEIICPDGNILKPITGISYDIRLKPGDMVPKECGLGGDGYFPSRDFQQICFMWKASALCHKPLYFEEVALERYGHTLVREEFQPIVSGLKFFLTIPVLPYKMGLNPPCECIYTLGYYRPGDCAPYMIDPLPLSIRAGLIEAGVIVGGIAIFP